MAAGGHAVDVPPFDAVRTTEYDTGYPDVRETPFHVSRGTESMSATVGAAMDVGENVAPASVLTGPSAVRDNNANVVVGDGMTATDNDPASTNAESPNR